MSTVAAPAANAAHAPAGAAPAAGAQAAPAAAMSGSLYVGDLAGTISETNLFDLFKQIGPVASIRVCRDAVTRRSLGYAYVNFYNAVDAERALDLLNYKELDGRPIRIMWSQRDPNLRRTNTGNIFIKNLDKEIDNKALYDTFSTFGQILSCKVATDEHGNSRGFGFVHYETREAADEAVAKVNGKLLNGKKCFVGPFVPRKERSGAANARWTNVFVKNLPASFDTEAKLEALFKPFGSITSLMLKKKEESGKVFGFVNFDEHDQAVQAVEELNGKEIDGNELYVGQAQKKAERERELREGFERLKRERMSKYQGVNLYVKNLDDSIDSEKLREAFAQCGTITSATVMVDDKGVSRGFGFVCFSTPEEATKAVAEMSGKMLVNKPIYVALAERRDQRRAKLEAQHAQRMQGPRMGGMPPQMGGAPVPYGAGVPFYPPQAGRGGGFVGYVPMNMARGRGYPQQRYMSGFPGAGAVPGQPGAGGPRMPRGRGGKGGAGGVPGGMPGQANYPGIKYNQNVRNPQQPQQAPPQQQQAPPQPQLQLPADPAERKQVLGENLFPLISASLKSLKQEDLSGKITGMLLESMESQDLLALIDDSKQLNKKIGEALEVLEVHMAQPQNNKPE